MTETSTTSAGPAQHCLLRVGIDDAPPVPMQIGRPEDGTFRGYEVDLLHELAQRLACGIEYRRAVWSVLIDELVSGSLDLIASAATVTEERRQQADFSTPYLKLALALVTVAQRAESEGRSDRIDLSSAHIGVRRGTTAEAFFRKESGGREPAMLSEWNEELYAALAQGQLDGVIDDSPIALHFAGAVPGLRYAQRFEGTDCAYAILVSRRHPALREKIDAALAGMEDDGTLPELRQRWFGSDALFVG